MAARIKKRKGIEAFADYFQQHMRVGAGETSVIRYVISMLED